MFRALSHPGDSDATWSAVREAQKECSVRLAQQKVIGLIPVHEAYD